MRPAPTVSSPLLSCRLLKAGKVDLDYLVRYTNAPWLVVQNPGGSDDGMFARDDDGNPLCWDQNANAPASALAAEVAPALKGELTLPDGRVTKPVFHLLAERYLREEYSPSAVSGRTGIPAESIRRIAAKLLTLLSRKK